MLNEQQVYLFDQIQSSQTGGQPYSDTPPMVECSMVGGINFCKMQQMRNHETALSV